jgi:hypothetical protein
MDSTGGAAVDSAGSEEDVHWKIAFGKRNGRVTTEVIALSIGFILLVLCLPQRNQAALCSGNTIKTVAAA